MFNNDAIYLAGQIFGIAPVIFGFISFQAKTSRGIIFWQLATAIGFSIHYFLIGALTGAALNFLAAIKGVSYYYRDKAGKTGLFLPVFFSVLAVITTALTWQAWYSLFLLTGLLINTLSFALLPPKPVRYLMLVKAPVTAMYNVFSFSIAGLVYETTVFTSAMVGIIRYREKKA